MYCTQTPDCIKAIQRKEILIVNAIPYSYSERQLLSFNIFIHIFYLESIHLIQA